MTCIDCGLAGRVYGAGRCSACGHKHFLRQQVQRDINKERSDRLTALRDHPSNHRRRHIRLIRCECDSPTIPCPVHEANDPSFWEMFA